MRQPVTVAGGGVITKPYVTWTLIGVTVAVFLWQFAAGVDAVAEDFGMWPFGITLYGEWWRLLTAAFLHGSWLHIAFNMYVLFLFGPTLERVLFVVRIGAWRRLPVRIEELDPGLLDDQRHRAFARNRGNRPMPSHRTDRSIFRATPKDRAAR